MAKEERVMRLNIMDMIDDPTMAAYFGTVCSKAVAEQMQSEPKADRIEVLLNSPGGDAFEGIAIHNLLRQYNAPVHVNIVGLAASAASIVAMAGDTVTMAPGSFIMIHNPMQGVQGNADDHRKAAETLDQIAGECASIYASKGTLTQEQFLDAMSRETWYGPQDAIDAGLCTAIDGDAATNMRAFVKPGMRMKFQNPPKEITEPEQERPAIDPKYDRMLADSQTESYQFRRRNNLSLT